MHLFRFLVNSKAKLIYIVLVLLFNIVACVYLLSFSGLKLPTITIPDFSLLYTDAKQKFSRMFVFPTPTPKDTLKHVMPTAPLIHPTITVTPSATDSAQLIDCIGPDGKHLFLSQQDCDNFNNAWKPSSTESPQASPTASVN